MNECCQIQIRYSSLKKWIYGNTSVPSFSFGVAGFPYLSLPWNQQCSQGSVAEKIPNPTQGQRARKPIWGKKAQRYPGIWLQCFFSPTQEVRPYSNISSFLGKFSDVLRVGSKNKVKLSETILCILSRKFTIGRCFLGHYHKDLLTSMEFQQMLRS